MPYSLMALVHIMKQDCMIASATIRKDPHGEAAGASLNEIRFQQEKYLSGVVYLVYLQIGAACIGTQGN